MPAEFTSDRLASSEKGVWRHQLRYRGALLSIDQVLKMWDVSTAFTDFFVELLNATPSVALRFECPPITAANLTNTFEFAIVDCPHLAVPANPRPFSSHFRSAAPGDSVVGFENLGGDAYLVVPTSGNDSTDFSHLLAFLKNSDRSKIHALWRRVGLEMRKRVGDDPVWLNTAGDGVAWLHVRLDSRPKYYHYAPYRTCS